jgi:hypothetical protein
MAQGDHKTVQKVTNSIFVMTHDEIKRIPKNQTVMYARVVVNIARKKQIHIVSASLLAGISLITPGNSPRKPQISQH